MHFPASTNVLVLAMQMDLGFDKTEAHMSDCYTNSQVVTQQPSCHNNSQAVTQ
jgi:hypothetical protein